MKLKIIAKNKKGENINLKLEKEKKFCLNNSIIEVDNKRGKELLEIKLNDYPIVEMIKEEKNESK